MDLRTSLALPFPSLSPVFISSFPFFSLLSLRGKVSSIVKDPPPLPFPTFCRVLSYQLYLNNTSANSPLLAYSLSPTNVLKVSHSTKCFHSLTHASVLLQLLSTAIPQTRGAYGLYLFFCCPIFFLSFFFQVLWHNIHTVVHLDFLNFTILLYLFKISSLRASSFFCSPIYVYTIIYLISPLLMNI